MIQNIPYKFNKFPVYYNRGSSEPPVSLGPLTFKGTNNSNAIALNKNGSPSAINLSYSKNGGEWTAYNWSDNNGDIITLASGDTVAFSGANNQFSTDASNYYKFVMTGSIEAGGNIQSLINFSDSAPDYCYRGLFNGCTSLTKPPAFPAITVGEYCCYQMFNGCSNLTDAPQLPATTLAQGCYFRMFGYCTSLSSAPSQIPAETLPQDSCYVMFNGCSNLLNAPNISATTLANSCCYAMFQNCSKLSSINVAFTSWAANANTSWVNNVAANGTFTCPAGLDTTTRGKNTVPENWTVVNT